MWLLAWWKTGWELLSLYRKWFFPVGYRVRKVTFIWNFPKYFTFSNFFYFLPHPESKRLFCICRIHVGIHVQGKKLGNLWSYSEYLCQILSMCLLYKAGPRNPKSWQKHWFISMKRAKTLNLTLEEFLMHSCVFTVVLPAWGFSIIIFFSISIPQVLHLTFQFILCLSFVLVNQVLVLCLHLRWNFLAVARTRSNTAAHQTIKKVNVAHSSNIKITCCLQHFICYFSSVGTIKGEL